MMSLTGAGGRGLLVSWRQEHKEGMAAEMLMMSKGGIKAHINCLGNNPQHSKIGSCLFTVFTGWRPGNGALLKRPAHVMQRNLKRLMCIVSCVASSGISGNLLQLMKCKQNAELMHLV